MKRIINCFSSGLKTANCRKKGNKTIFQYFLVNTLQKLLTIGKKQIHYCIYSSNEHQIDKYYWTREEKSDRLVIKHENIRESEIGNLLWSKFFQ